MTNMFENYDNMPSSYIPDNTHAVPVTHSKAHNPMEEYNAKGDFIGYSWHYGDSVILEFHTTGEVIYDDPGVYEDAETYLKDKTFELGIFDFRHEAVYKAVMPAAIVATFILEKEASETLPKGVYYLNLTLITGSDEERESTYTLIDSNSCRLIIK